MNNQTSISTDIIINKVYTIRGQQVMLDFDAAELYEVDVTTLRRTIKRNHKRFPPDFLYILTDQEWTGLRTQVAPPLWEAQTSPPLALSTAGLFMVSSVLKSKRAAEVSVHIINSIFAFRKM
ncbi:ORF6N domain-containing protein [Mucilaginibacter sp. dw_454]|uniref:ORF6N domain-containing protein n=1 Tax=Mucilaginibacter sp. dw_454 TaxID=2720079 RepID=UPI001BD1D6A3|nr:ORF6N domain-containing protein [Mucilaginibacter sp. dw_454]